MFKGTLTTLAHKFSPTRRAVRPERLQALTDEQLADVYQRWSDRRFVVDAVTAEADRRDRVDEKARRKAARLDRRRAKEARMRDAYQEWVEASYLMAEEFTRGHLLNETGKAAGVDSFSLFSGQGARARKYASPELLEFWTFRPRITYSEFKAGAREAAHEESAA